MSTIYLIRHGKTEANERHLYCGATDLPLSPAGEAELRKLHYDTGKARFITSGMIRTEQTLQLLFGPVPHGADPDFREMNFGAFEMQSYEMLRDTPQYQAWISGDNETNVTPGGESGRQMQYRALNAFRKIEELDGDWVIVTHGGIIAAIMASLFPEEQRNRYQWQPSPGHGYGICGSSFFPIPVSGSTQGN